MKIETRMRLEKRPRRVLDFATVLLGKRLSAVLRAHMFLEANWNEFSL